MKNFKFLFGFLAVGLMASCGGGGGEKEKAPVSESMKPETTTVSGDLGECFVVVDREYKLTDNGALGRLLTVELERTEAALPFELTSSTDLADFGTSKSKPFIKVGFGIEFLDDDGNVLDKVSASSGPYSHDEAPDLVRLKPGEKGSIRFSVRDKAQQATKFRISSAYAEDAGWEASGSSSSDGDESSVSESDDNISSASSSSDDFDEFYASYEKFVNKYIAVMKKAKNGDASAMLEAASLLEDANEAADKIDNIKGDLTPAQLSKFTKLQQKLASAAL